METDIVGRDFHFLSSWTRSGEGRLASLEPADVAKPLRPRFPAEIALRRWPRQWTRFVPASGYHVSLSQCCARDDLRVHPVSRAATEERWTIVGNDATTRRPALKMIWFVATFGHPSRQKLSVPPPVLAHIPTFFVTMLKE